MVFFSWFPPLVLVFDGVSVVFDGIRCVGFLGHFSEKRF